MLRFCAQKLTKQIKSYKHSKFKQTQVLLLNLLDVENNLTFSHANFTSLARKFHTNSHLSARIFRNTENVYAYKILQSIPITDRSVFAITSPNMTISSLEDFDRLLDQDWRSKSAPEIVEGFKSASACCKEHNINISDKRFDKLVDGLMDRVQDLTDSQLSELLVCLSDYPVCESFTAHNFHDVWSALDDACCWRVGSWPNETLFQFAELWYRLHLGKQSDFLFSFIDRMRKRVEFMSKDEIVHLFFYLKVHKRQKVDFEYHYVLDKYANCMSLDEMALAAMVFAQSEIKLKLETTALAMIGKLKQELKTADEICVRRIVEVLRYSTHVLLVDQLMDLLDHLVPEIDRYSNLCCIHIALLGTTLQFFHKESLEKVAQKLLAGLEDPNQVRLKDMERLLIALTMFDFSPNTSTDIFDSIFKELHKEHRRKEFVQYPRCLPSALTFLSFRKIYSYELMDEILNKDSYIEVYGKNSKSFSRDLFSLDTDIEVECPDYKGNRLDKILRRKVAKWNTEFTPSWDQHKKLTTADKFFLDVIDTSAKIVQGHHNLVVDHVLPNFVKSDIILCVNGKGLFVQPAGFDSYTLGDVMRPPEDKDLKWFAIVPVNWNNAIRNTKKPLGLINKKCRQLKTLGYEPILVMWNEFLELSEKEKIAYIERRIRKKSCN